MNKQTEFFRLLENLLIIILGWLKDYNNNVKTSNVSTIEDDKSGEQVPSTPYEEPEVYLNFKEMCSFLDIASSTGYQRIGRNEIPHFKKGRRLYFKKSDLKKYVESGRRMTKEELDQVAEQHFNNYRNRNKF